MTPEQRQALDRLVIFFAPRYKPAGVKFMIQKGVPYAKTLEQLDQELKKVSGVP